MLYLDNAATTKIHKEVLDEMIASLSSYGNSEAKFYEPAENAKKLIELSRSKVSHIINANKDEIIFTSGATEANNLVLKGCTMASELKHKKIIISSIEHSSVYDTCNYLKNCGVEIDIVPVDATGSVSLDYLNKSINSNTILVSIIAVNHEIGTIQDLTAIDEICYRHNVPFHTDATQAIGRIRINLNKFKALSYLTFTAHKIYGPKGIGCLYCRADTNGLKPHIVPLLHGGEQENGLRAGTSSNMLIAGFGKACEIAERDFESNVIKNKEFEEIILCKFKRKFGDRFVLNNNFGNRVYGILNVQLQGYNNLILLKTMAPIIAASTGSACSVSKPSRILKQIGLSDLRISESIRLSCSPYACIADFDEIDKL